MKACIKQLNIMIRAGILVLILSTSLTASPIWVTGIVTKVAWFDRYRRIEVDHVKYTLMPDNVNITKRYKEYDDRYLDKKIPLAYITKGRKIMMRAQGHTVYQIILLGR